MEDFTVADVYEHAAKIGQDIERLIREYGEDAVEELMPKIVFTLEQLEGLAERRQKDVAAINDLYAEKERLLIECKKELAVRRQAEEKVDYLENLMKEDTKSLQHTIGLLKKENEFLRSEVEELDEEVLTQKNQSLPGNVDLVVKMKMAIDAQKDEIREVNQENGRYRSEIEALNEQTNRLTEMNERLRIYNSKLQDRLAETIGHKVQAEATLASVKLANDLVDEKEVREIAIANEIKLSSANEVTSNEELNIKNKKAFDKKEGKVKEENEIVKQKSERNIDELNGREKQVETGIEGSGNKNEAEKEENGFVVVPKTSKDTDKEERKTKNNKIKDKENSGTKKVSTANEGTKKTEDDTTKTDQSKQESPRKDPNRPRYTLAEMQQVLEERNRYKERVSVLEDVLESYVPGPIRSSTLEKGDETFKSRKDSAGRKGKETPKRPSKVRGIFGSFWKGSS